VVFRILVLRWKGSFRCLYIRISVSCSHVYE